jgi:hypothetical protein
MSCVEDLEKKYPAFAFSVRGGAVLEKTRIGVIYLRRIDLIPIQYFSVRPKKLKLKTTISLTYIGLNPLDSYTCWCGGGIYKIAVFVKNPFKQLQDLMNTIIMMQMLLQTIGLLSSLTTIFM